MRKEKLTKPRTRRPSVLHELPELNVAAVKAGLPTLAAIARKINKNEDVVSGVLRREKRAKPTEQLIASALGVTVEKLRKICKPPAVAA